MNIPKHLLINFDELKVGQRVWSAQQGYVTIRDITGSERYPIVVYSSESNKENRFTRDGHWFQSDLLPTLFLDCPFVEEERVVEVSNAGENWCKMTLVFKIPQGFVCYNHHDANIKGGLQVWNFMRELQPEPIKEEDPKIIEVSMDDVASMLSKLLGSDIRIVKK